MKLFKTIIGVIIMTFWVGSFSFGQEANPALSGLNKAKAGDFKSAIADYNKALTLYEKDLSKKSYIFNDRGLCYAGLGQHNIAIQDFDKAIALNPKEALFYNNRALSKVELNDSIGAISDLTTAIGLKSDYADAYYNRANVYDGLGGNNNLYLALRDYTQAISIDNSNPDYFVNKAVTQFKLNNSDDALRCIFLAREIYKKRQDWPNCEKMDSFAREILRQKK